MAPLQHRILPKSANDVRHQQELMQTRVTAGDTLNLGDRGAAITALKAHLRSAGLLTGDAGSEFTADTEAALKNFQRAEGLPQTGEVDQATLRKVKGLDVFVRGGFKTVAHVGQRGADVAQMERKLKKLHLNVGKVDGIFDGALKRAVSKFQRQHGLHVSGAIGRGTAKATNKALAIEKRLAHSPKLRLVRDLAMYAKKHGIPAELPIMTALVESNFSNPSGGDRDSVGMFQQRAPWGPYSVRHDPRKSVKLFINGGRGGQPGALDYKSRYIHRGPAGYGDWCQAVQVSAFPDRYQQRLGEARRLLRLAGVPLGLKKH